MLGQRLAQMLCLVAIVAATIAQAASPAPMSPSPPAKEPIFSRACWIFSTGRGVGTVPDRCGPGLEVAGEFCYPPCAAGYTPFVASCFSKCPAGYRDDGALCTRPPHIFGKGCCCTIFTRGCCNACPPGYNDDGCTCHRYMHTIAKTSYTRSTNLKVCAPGLEMDAGLCYKPCPPGMRGVGPVCWGSAAPTGFPIKCNDIAWAKDKEACDGLNENLQALGLKVGVSSVACIAAIAAAAGSAGALAAIPSAVCPTAIKVAASGIENGLNLAKFGICK